MALTKVKAGNILLTTPAASSNDVTPATTQYVTTAISNLVAGAPATLNTLDEIAAALNDDAALNTTLTNAIATKVPLDGSSAMTGNLQITNSSGGSYFKAVQTTNSSNAGLYMRSGSSIWYNLVDTSGNYQIYDGDANEIRVIVDSDGKVGIGLNNPAHLLHVKKPGSGDAALFLETVTGGDPTIYFNSAAANRSGLIRFQDNGTNVGKIHYVHNGDRIEFQAGSATGASLIVANNRVGIGVTGTPGNRLTVTENLSSQLVANIGNTHASGFGVNIYGGAGSNYALRAEDYSGNERFIVRGDGNVGIGGGGGENSIRLNVTTPTQNHIGLQVQNTNTADSFGMIVKAGNDANDYTADFRKRDNTNIMRIRGDGNIGIGTTNPNAYAGQTAVTINSTGVARLDLDISDTMQGFLLAESGYAALYAAAGNYAAMGVSGTGKSVKIHSSGNVGIGNNASATHPLHVSVGVSNDTIDETKGLVKLQSSGGNGTIMGTLASSPYTSYIQSGYVVDTSVAQYPISLNPLGGNVGIGTTNPLQALEVVKSGFAYIRTRSTSSGFTGFDIGQHSGGGIYLNNRDNTSIIFQTNNSPRMYLNNTGNLGVGVANPLSPLSVQADTGAGAMRFIGRASDSIASVGFYNSGQSSDTYLQSNGAWQRARADSGFHFRRGGTPTVTDTDGFTIEGMNVGVGTANPSEALEVAGTVKITGSSRLLLPNFWIGPVPNTANNNTGAVLLVNLTTINNNNVGFQFSGSIIGNSYTGQAFVNVNIVKHYSVDSVAFDVADDQNLNSVVGRMQLNLCTVTYSGSSYLAIVKNGGGTGTMFLNGYFQGWYPDQVTEVASGTYTITTNHGNLNF